MGIEIEPPEQVWTHYLSPRLGDIMFDVNVALDSAYKDISIVWIIKRLCDFLLMSCDTLFVCNS